MGDMLLISGVQDESGGGLVECKEIHIAKTSYQ